MSYHVIIPLQTYDIYDIETRVKEIHTIKEWLDELVEWQEDQYSWHVSVTSGKIHVWLKQEKHATMCILKWS